LQAYLQAVCKEGNLFVQNGGFSIVLKSERWKLFAKKWLGANKPGIGSQRLTSTMKRSI
jgi:hypothetical protein